MATLTVSARGQVTFGTDVLRHLGLRPGGKVTLDLLPDGRPVRSSPTRTCCSAPF